MNQKKKNPYFSYFNSNWVKPIRGIGLIIIIVKFFEFAISKNTNPGYVATQEEVKQRDWGERLDGSKKLIVILN